MMFDKVSFPARKPQSIKTITEKKKCVSRFSVSCIGPSAPILLGFQKEQNITISH